MLLVLLYVFIDLIIKDRIAYALYSHIVVFAHIHVCVYVCMYVCIILYYIVFFVFIKPCYCISLLNVLTSLFLVPYFNLHYSHSVLCQIIKLGTSISYQILAFTFICCSWATSKTWFPMGPLTVCWVWYIKNAFIKMSFNFYLA